MTPAENEWLTIALERGYERPFISRAKSLVSLERQGLVERNPSSGYPPEWRITVKGSNEYELV